MCICLSLRRFPKGARSCVTGSDRGLERVGPKRATEHLGTLERRETTADEKLIPAGAVVIEKQDGLCRRADPRARARRLDLHQPALGNFLEKQAVFFGRSALARCPSLGVSREFVMGPVGFAAQAPRAQAPESGSLLPANEAGPIGSRAGG